MAGVAFILLKAGRRRPESTKQAEIRLAILLKILPIAGFAAKTARKGCRAHAVVVPALTSS